MSYFRIILLILIIIPTQLNAFERYNHVTKYDQYFSKYSKRYFGPGFNWRQFKAQAIAESNLKEKVRSKVGAVGLMQIMPATFEEIKYKSKSIKGNRSQPRWNIAAGIFYDRQMWKKWKSERPYQDRLDFMFGSYNAGTGNILRAQMISKKKGYNPNLWKSIKTTLPQVTKKRSRETIGYVKKIKKIKEVLK